MTAPPFHNRQQRCAGRLLAYLRRQGYHHTTITPLTHAHVLANRAGAGGSTLRDLFGWNLPFDRQAFPTELVNLMHEAGVLEALGQQWRSKVRVSSIDDALSWTPAYPTEQEDAVFFGPDTYRFVRFMRQALAAAPLRRHARILDIGCGSGAGGLMLARQCEDADLVLNDINPLALRYCAVNAAGLGLDATLLQADSLAAVDGEFDLIVANPPYLVDSEARIYRHGGDDLGRSLGLRMATEGDNGWRLGDGYCSTPALRLSTARIPCWRNSCQYWNCWPDLALRGNRPRCVWRRIMQLAYKGVDRIAAIGLEARRDNR